MRVAAAEMAATEMRDRLVMEHVPLVKTMAQRLAQRLPSQVEVSDLVSVGVLGLIDAAGRYKPASGVPFDAFARRRVQGAMLDSLRELDWAPRSLRRLRRDVAADEMILDVGPAAVEGLGDALKSCQTLVWNGPLGAFETPPFDVATVALARTAAALTTDGSLVSVAGGGDTVAALNQAGVGDQFSFVSTAGGAFLEWMEGKALPGVAALAR